MTMLEDLNRVLPRLRLILADAPAVTAHLLALRDRLADGSPEDVAMLTIDDAREFVRKGRGKGVDCPVCSQHAKIYSRPLTNEMVGCLFQLVQWFVKERDWIEGKRFKKRGGDYAKLAHWGLIEFEKTKASKRRQSGRMRPTKLGVQFALAQVSVPSHVLLYNTNVVGHDCGANIYARDVRGFNYDEVYAAVAGAEDLPW